MILRYPHSGHWFAQPRLRVGAVAGLVAASMLLAACSSVDSDEVQPVSSPGSTTTPIVPATPIETAPPPATAPPEPTLSLSFEEQRIAPSGHDEIVLRVQGMSLADYDLDALGRALNWHEVPGAIGYGFDPADGRLMVTMGYGAQPGVRAITFATADGLMLAVEVPFEASEPVVAATTPAPVLTPTPVATPTWTPAPATTPTASPPGQAEQERECVDPPQSVATMLTVFRVPEGFCFVLGSRSVYDFRTTTAIISDEHREIPGVWAHEAGHAGQHLEILESGLLLASQGFGVWMDTPSGRDFEEAVGWVSQGPRNLPTSWIPPTNEEFERWTGYRGVPNPWEDSAEVIAAYYVGDLSGYPLRLKWAQKWLPALP